MKGIAWAAAVLLAAGCTTYSERQAAAPWHVVTSDKPVSEYEGCISPRMRDVYPQLTAARDGDAVVITFPIPRSRYIASTVTLTPAGTGTRAELRSATQGGAYARFAQHMDACR